MRAEYARFMESNPTKPVFRYVIDLLKLIDAAAKIKTGQVIKSRKIWMYFSAMLLSELIGLTVAIFLATYSQNAWAVEGSIVSAFKCTSWSFRFIWAILRIACGQWNKLLGDFLLFEGPGALYDGLAGSLHATLGFVIYLASGSAWWAVILSTSLQSCVYLPLTARLFGPLLIVRE